MKVKANSVKQEYEKQDELKRSALRAVAALLTIPDAGEKYKNLLQIKINFIIYFINFFSSISDKNPSLSEFVTQIKSTPELQPLFEVIQKDCTGSNVNETNVMDQS